MRDSLGAHETMALAAVSTKLVVLTVSLATGLATLHAVEARPFSAFLLLLITLGPLLAVVAWLRADAQARKVRLVFDWGFLAYIGWPVLIPWYIYRSRGPHGWPLTLVLFLGIVAPWLAVFVVLFVQHVSTAVVR